jgi:hypothetical protein
MAINGHGGFKAFKRGEGNLNGEETEEIDGGE